MKIKSLYLAHVPVPVSNPPFFPYAGEEIPVLQPEPTASKPQKYKPIPKGEDITLPLASLPRIGSWYVWRDWSIPEKNTATQPFMWEGKILSVESTHLEILCTFSGSVHWVKYTVKNEGQQTKNSNRYGFSESFGAAR